MNRRCLPAAPISFVFEELGFGDDGLCGGKWVALGELELMPVGVGDLRLAGGVEFGDLLGCELEVDAGEVGAELFFVACTDDERGDSGAAEQPVERDLWDGSAGFFGHLVE